MKKRAILVVLAIIGMVGVCQCLAVDLFNVIERPVCTAAGDQINPDGDVRYIVWQDNRDGDWDIYLYDWENDKEVLLCGADGNQVNPCLFLGGIVDVSRVVWQDDRNGNWDIYCAEFNFVKAMNGVYEFQEKAICEGAGDQICPDMRNDYVVWQDMRNGSWDIYGYTFADGNEILICDEAGDQIWPTINGENEVVWEDWRSGEADIYWYDVEDGNSFAVCTADGNQVCPLIIDQSIVWQDDRNGNWDIYGWDGGDDMSQGQEIAICIDANSQQQPAGGSFWLHEYYPVIAVWQDDRNGNWDILGYNPSDERDIVICDAAGDQKGAGITDITNVYWQDNRNGGWDIYRATICPKGNDDCGECVIELEVNEAYVGTTHGMTGLKYARLIGDGSVPIVLPFMSSCGYKDEIDAWFIYEPTVGGPVTIATDGDFDTTLAVYNGGIYRDGCYEWELPTELACNDDYATANTNSRVVLDVVKGKSYYVRLAGFNGQMGDYSIIVTQGGQAGNSRSDLNGDGSVDWADFAIFASEWLLGAE